MPGHTLRSVARCYSWQSLSLYADLSISISDELLSSSHCCSYCREAARKQVCCLAQILPLSQLA